MGHWSARFRYSQSNKSDHTEKESAVNAGKAGYPRISMSDVCGSVN
jgi:hypothetical protein